jgi:hypothetical protein
MIINRMKKPALISSGIDTNSVPTKFLMLGRALMLLKGLITLNILRGFKFMFRVSMSINLKI